MRFMQVACLFAFAAAMEAEITVRVEDPSGARVPEAAVALRDAAGVVVARGTTAVDGELAFRESGNSVQVRAAGFRGATAAIDGRTVMTVTLELPSLERELRVDAPLEAVAPVAAESVEPDRVAGSDLVASLRETPQVSVIRRGGTNFEPVVQGLRETQLAMIVDGTRTFAAGPARMDSELSHVDPGSIDTVAVVTGPYALEEGAGAMAAIIVKSSEIPLPSAWRVNGRLGLGWRSNGNARLGQARVHAGNSTFGFDLRATGDLLDDYRAGGGGGQLEALVPSDASAHQLGTKLRFQPTAHQELLLGGYYDEQTGVDYPGRLLTAEHFLLRAWESRYRWERPEKILRAMRLNAYLHKKSHRMSNREKPTAMDMPMRMPPFALDVSLPAESDTAGGAGRVELVPSEAWRIHAGFDVFRLEQDAQRFIARDRDRKLLFEDRVWAGTSLRNLGAYAFVGRSYARGEMRGTVRLDSVASAAGNPSDYFRAHSGTDLERRESNASASLAGRLDLGGGLTIAGGFGRVVRTANALERYSDRFPSTRFQVAAEFMGDPAIRPEASVQGDLSLAWKRGNLRFHAGGFVRRIGDYITVLADPSLEKRLPLSPPAVFRYINGESALFRGWNFGLSRVADRVEIRVQASKTIADDRELMQPVLGIPPLEVSSTVRFRTPGRRFYGQYGMRNVWDQRRVSVARMETPSPGFTVHGFRFGANLWTGATMYLGVENAGDRRYYEHLNSLNPFTRQRVPELGRAVTLGFSTTW